MHTFTVFCHIMIAAHSDRDSSGYQTSAGTTPQPSARTKRNQSITLILILTSFTLKHSSIMQEFLLY